MDQTFEITEDEAGALQVVSVAGEIDVATAPQPRATDSRPRWAAGNATIGVNLLRRHLPRLDHARRAHRARSSGAGSAGGDLRLVIGRTAHPEGLRASLA